MDVSRVARDLADEQQVLDDIVAALREDQWALQTPSPRWTIADQIGHLTYFDHAATVAITDPEAFQGLVADLVRLAGADDETVDDFSLRTYRALSPTELLSAWRRNRASLDEAATTLADDTRIIWYGPSMGSKSFLTARLMEVWAHGQDIVDTVGAEREPTDRLRHIAQLGFITRGWSYVNRGLEAPRQPLLLELTAPSGETWTFGPDDATESARGPALDFCLVATQRRHLDDTDLDATPGAREWLLLAQAFAGPATDGPESGDPTVSKIETVLDGGVFTVTLADEANRNALSIQLLTELVAAIDRADTDDEIRVVVLTNRGHIFCAGADLRERSNPDISGSTVDMATVFGRIRQSPKPFVGRISGHAIAGGLGLAASLDISIAIEDAKMGFTEVRIGVAPAIISVICLPKMSRADAAAAFLQGNRFLAPEAARLGLINKSVPADQLDDAVDQVVADLLLGAPGALAASKQLLTKIPTMEFDTGLEWAAELSGTLFSSPEGREGMAAYLEKRPPAWAPRDEDSD